MTKFALFAGTAALLASSAFAGTPSAPSLKPPLTYAGSVVDAKDAELLRDALRAADRADWGEVRSLQFRVEDPAVEDIILWRRATGDEAMSFRELNEALERLSAWPLQRTMRISAESRIALSSLGPRDKIEWLEASGPVSGEGKVALADAYRAIGEAGKANAYAIDAWRNNSLDRPVEQDVLSRYGNLFSQADHRARADLLLWVNKRSEASRVKSRLNGGHRELVDARMALSARRKGVNKKVAAVPEALHDHPGLLFERARWRRKAGQKGTIAPLLVQIDGNDVPHAGRSKLWKERHLAARKALQEGKFQTAYALTAPHGLSEGAEFAEAEWLSGWIALRHNNEPDRALQHFETLSEGVSTPISLARAYYWKGRALSELADPLGADEAYKAAAQYSFTYYGQLASEQIGGVDIAFDAAAEPTLEERDAFYARDEIRALKLLGEIGEDSLFRRLSYHLDDGFQTASEIILLSEIANDFQQPHVGVRGAKAGLANGIIAPDAAYPLVDYPLLREPDVERPYMLALSRQESEMNPRAISHANARGLMQFLPATAKLEARRSGLPYRSSWLTDDPGYNMTLGGAHLDHLLDRFNGSYIMTAAAYNAGASRPSKWVEEYGDPRAGEIDAVDWVEFIPFSETRNYVQRVLENVQVYRHRLTGEPARVMTDRDIRRGRF